jgi:hypothetical protein
LNIRRFVSNSAPSVFDYTFQRRIGYSVVYEFTQQWLSDRALKYAADAVLGDLLSARIISRWANDVGFTYRSFLEFFVAKAMQINPEFKAWVTDLARYLSFTFELEYYSGLDRNDSTLLNQLKERFSSLESEAIKQLGFELDLTRLEQSKPPPSKDTFDVSIS